MNAYLLLFLAIACEVLGTMLLPLSDGFTNLAPSSLLLMAYAASFYLLSIVSQMLPLAVIYASWSGLGVFSVACLSALIYGQTLNWQSLLGLLFVVFGITMINLFRSPLA